MAVYVIGDIQGCYRNLKRLLKDIKFKPDRDKIWLVGDLVNRGPDSLKTLRFVKQMGEQAITVLGNHDLHMMSVFYDSRNAKNGDTFEKIFIAEDGDELIEWLRFRPLMHFDADLNFALVHAGIYPAWTISRALQLAAEVESKLQGKNFKSFLKKMYGNEPALWSEDLAGMQRLRFITNAFTRMRYLGQEMCLEMKSKGNPEKLRNGKVFPWFEMKAANKFNRVAFGHWSTLPIHQYGNNFALDSGCVWGGRLTALRIDKKTPRWFSLACSE